MLRAALLLLLLAPAASAVTLAVDPGVKVRWDIEPAARIENGTRVVDPDASPALSITSSHRKAGVLLVNDRAEPLRNATLTFSPHGAAMELALEGPEAGDGSDKAYAFVPLLAPGAHAAATLHMKRPSGFAGEFKILAHVAFEREDGSHAIAFTLLDGAVRSETAPPPAWSFLFVPAAYGIGLLVLVVVVMRMRKSGEKPPG